MNKMNKCALIVFSSMFTIACFAMVTESQKTIQTHTTIDCADIKDPVKKRECDDRQKAFLGMLN